MNLRLLALAAAALALAGCVVAPPPGPRPVYARACPYGTRWIPGHYGPYGAWRPAHCG